MNFKARVSFFALIITALLFAGCNIFSWSASPEEGEDLLDEGLDFMFEGDFKSAESLFALGLLEDSLNSDLLYNHAKATLLLSRRSIITIVNEMTKFSDKQEVGKELPFLSNSIEDQDTLYVTNITIVKDLTPIFNEETTGSIESSDISLDIFIANTVKGILRISDTNGDGRIDDKDINLNLLISGDGDFAFDSTLFSNLSEEELNDLISSVGDIIDGNSDFLDDIIGETGIDTTTIDSLLDEITGSMGWYYVNTGGADIADNPGIGNNDSTYIHPDGSLDSRTDEECIDQEDNDDDGLIDEDALIDSEIIKLFPQWLPGDPCPL